MFATENSNEIYAVYWQSPLVLLIAVITTFFCNVADIHAQPVDESKFISIGAIEQWVTIAGEDRSKPAILFIHGGPGSVLSPYAEAIYGSWKNDFVIINWDQRGAGKTFGKNAPAEVTEDYWIDNPLTIDQMVDDGIEVTKYALQYLGKEKLILMGTSWGSILATKMILKNPGLFYAYVGHAQFVSFDENMKMAFDEVNSLARTSNDEEALKKLDALGKPPYSDARTTGQFLRIVKSYEAENSTPAPEEWWKPASEYDNEKDTRDRYHGDDYSFLYFAGHKALGIESMAADVNFLDASEFKAPVYLIQGDHDLLTSPGLSRRYFEKIEAPDKGYFVVPDAAHGFNRSVVDQQYRVLLERVCRHAPCTD